LYDIWGDTVNVAARMDYFGMPGKIQVCHIFALLRAVSVIVNFIYMSVKKYERSWIPNLGDGWGFLRGCHFCGLCIFPDLYNRIIY
jgi:hypothetical protein